MAEEPDEALIAALQRLIAGQARGDDLPRLQQAMTDGRITLAASDRPQVENGDLESLTLLTGRGQSLTQIDSRGALGFLYQPSGSVQQNFIQVSSPELAQALLTQLQAYSPPPLPAPGSLPEPGPLPPGSRLPFPRNAVFTGRESDLHTLATSLLAAGDAASTIPTPTSVPPTAPGLTRAAALTGTDGIGKTQLAVEFCYHYGRFFHGVHWLQADQDLTAEIAACGAELGLTPWPESLPEQAQATLLAWERGGPRLVVLDNVADPQVVQDYLPQLPGGRILLTSRLRDWPPDLGLALLPLEALPRPQSLALLRKLAPRLARVSDQDLDLVAGRLGDLPLALDLVGRYLDDRMGLSVTGFLLELEKAGGALGHSALRDWTENNPTGHATDLAATFTLSWDRLDSPAARLLFCACGYCAASTPIPWDVFHRFAVEQDPAIVDEDLGALEDRGLIQLGEAGIVIHLLLSEFARLQDAVAAQSALPRLAEALADLCTAAGESGLPERFKPLRPHVEAAAAWAELYDLEQAGALWNNLGYHLDDVAEYAGAKIAYENALRIAQTVYGPGDPRVAAIANNLGGVLQDLGDYPAAQAAFDRALRINEAAFGPDHPQVAVIVNNQGSLLQELGDPAGAKAAFERVLRIDEAAFGPDHPAVAARLNNLGSALQDLGDHAGGQAAFERALAIFEKQLGPQHPNVAAAANNLGMALQALGDLPRAQAAYQRAFRIDEAAFGPDHPVLARDLNNLGSVLRAQGEDAAAIDAYRRALAILEKFLPPDHPNLRIVRHNLEGLSTPEINAH
jgi:tetratricopeptide (TPR) repeat protein